MLIDEIEVALHPIAVSRLMDELRKLERTNLMVILSSHSPEIIRKVNPANLYQLELVSNGSTHLTVNNPCYPSYAIRDVYMHDGFDYVILVEDHLARLLVRRCIEKHALSRSKLINVLPAGGWLNVLRLQHELYVSATLGAGTKVLSVLDGDVREHLKADSPYARYPKLFLPVKSVEKFLQEVILSGEHLALRKEIKDRFFYVRSLDEVVAEYHRGNKAAGLTDEDGKRLYRELLDELRARGMNEDNFIEKLADIVEQQISFDKFIKDLGRMLQI